MLPRYIAAMAKKLPKVIEETVGERIRAMRLANKMTQEDFAAKLGVSRSAIAQWETDRAGQVRANMERIAKVLKTSVGYLASGEAGSLQGEEQTLMRLYRECSKEDQKLMMQTAARLANA